MRRVPEDLERWPRRSRDEWRLEALYQSLEYARQESAVYRELWSRHGVSPADLDSIHDLSRFPIVDKTVLTETLRSQTPPVGTSVGFSTRGTSGKPLIVWVDEVELEGYVAPCVRGFRWAGLQSGDRAMLLSPAWHRLAAMEGFAAVELGATPCHFWGTISDLSHVDYFLDAVVRLRPDFLTSTPPFLVTAVRRCEAMGRDSTDVFASVRSASVVGVAVTAGLRRFLSERMGVDHVFQRGGSNEGASMDECVRHDGMHVHEDCCHIEVVDDKGETCAPGEIGRMVVTKLVAGGRPFVRYDTGDRAAFVPGECKCGIEYVRLRMLGRPESTVTVEGRPVTGYEVRSVLDEQSDLVGRVALVVRDNQQPNVLRVAVEGDSVANHPEAELAEALGLQRVSIEWLGAAKVSWGFRDVVDARELTTNRR